jgi:hypothetical protein
MELIERMENRIGLDPSISLFSFDSEKCAEQQPRVQHRVSRKKNRKIRVRWETTGRLLRDREMKKKERDDQPICMDQMVLGSPLIVDQLLMPRTLPFSKRVRSHPSLRLTRTRSRSLGCPNFYLFTLFI